MIQIINDILTIIGLTTVALVLPCLIITGVQHLLLFVLKQSGKLINANTKARYSGIYIPNYIKKLRCVIPQFTNKGVIKPTCPIPNLENRDSQILIHDATNIIKSPITKLEKSPSKQASHTETLPQEKKGNQPNANKTKKNYAKVLTALKFCDII